MRIWSAGLAAVLVLVLGIPHAGAASRLEWGPARVAWHDACTFSHGPGARDHAARHRFVVIQGTLRSMAREDASLYAVFLDSGSDLPTLQERLAVASPRDLRADANAAFCCEWVPLASNGRLTLFVDEAHQAGKTVVAIVNAKGDILGTHPLWTSADLAQAG